MVVLIVMYAIYFARLIIMRASFSFVLIGMVRSIFIVYSILSVTKCPTWLRSMLIITFRVDRTAILNVKL